MRMNKTITEQLLLEAEQHEVQQNRVGEGEPDVPEESTTFGASLLPFLPPASTQDLELNMQGEHMED